VGDSKLILSALLPLVNQKDDLEFLKSKQKAMKDWNRLLEEKSTRTDKPIKPQVIAKAVSEELEDNAIISADWYKHFLGCSLHRYPKRNEIFCIRYTIKYG
jgi:pyruvate dehydrogenase (quinone)